LVSGCTVVLKPPDETPLFGSLVAEVFAEAGLPPGVLNIVAADRQVSEALGGTRWWTRSASRAARARAGASPPCAASS
jgi:delta 1-pyrroline-5-carboxylate dehydrogenase